MKKFADKQLKLENTMMKEVTKPRKTHTICSLKHADLSFASLATYVQLWYPWKLEIRKRLLREGGGKI